MNHVSLWNVKATTIARDTLKIAIFAVDDRNSQKCCSWLTKEGLQVEFCADVDQLMSRIQETPNMWSTLIIDTKSMGDSDELLRAIDRSHRYFCRLLIIFLSGRGDRNDFHISLPTIRSAVLTKPFTRDQLVSALPRDTFTEVKAARHSTRARPDTTTIGTVKLSTFSTG